MTEIEKWIGEAIAQSEMKIVQLLPTDAKRVVDALMATYVIENPRSWWLKLRHPFVTCSSVDVSLEYLVAKMFSNDSADKLFFIPETGKPDLPVYLATAAEVTSVTNDCPLFEYYVANQKKDWLIIENDHDEFVLTREKGRLGNLAY